MTQMLRFFNEADLTGMSDAERELFRSRQTLATTLFTNYQLLDKRIRCIEGLLQGR
jgi:hypothetical protein